MHTEPIDVQCDESQECGFCGNDHRTTGIYFRVEREGKWRSLDLIEMTEKEIETVIHDRAPESSYWFAGLIHMLLHGHPNHG